MCPQSTVDALLLWLRSPDMTGLSTTDSVLRLHRTLDLITQTAKGKSRAAVPSDPPLAPPLSSPNPAPPLPMGIVCLSCSTWSQSSDDGTLPGRCHNCPDSAAHTIISNPQLNATDVALHHASFSKVSAWQTLSSIPPPIWSTVIDVLTVWAGIVERHRQRINRQRLLVSVPIQIGSTVFALLQSVHPFVLNLVDLWPQYHQSDPQHLVVTLRTSKTPLPAHLHGPWILSSVCRKCSRPSAWATSVFHEPVSPVHSNTPADPPIFCTQLHTSDPVTTRTASDTISFHEGSPIRGALPLSLVRSGSCAPSCPLVPNNAPLAHFDGQLRLLYENKPIDKLLAKSLEMNGIVVMSVNCCSVRLKLPKLVSLILFANPDVVCLQEVWANFDSRSLSVLPFFILSGDLFNGGGLATLVHRRLSHGKAKPEKDHLRHSLGISLRIAPHAVLTVLNCHFPPGTDNHVRNSHIKWCSEFAIGKPAGVKLLMGDLNISLAQSGSWLAQAMSRGKRWSLFRCPYPTGEPTNFVLQKGVFSAKEIDWILVSCDTPCSSASKVLLPGLSTHKTVVCTLGLADDIVIPRDSSGRLFKFNEAGDLSLDRTAQIASLLLWWATLARLSPDASILFYWQGIKTLIGPARPVFKSHEPDQLRITDALDAAQGTATASQVREWWQSRHDEAFGTLLKIQLSKLKGVSITAVTGRALRVRAAKFVPVTELSSDGITFADTPERFRDEALSQGKELYASRGGMKTDVDRLAQGVAAASSAIHDDPDFRSLMHHLLRPDDVSSPSDTPPTFNEVWLQRATGSEATSLEELPHAVVSRLEGFGVLGALYLMSESQRLPASSLLLNAVIHLCLVKKQPRWLLRNSRPILLEAYLKRLLSTIIFKRFQRKAEVLHWIPTISYAYRPQISPQYLAIVTRWLIAQWVVEAGSLYAADWDEANAFCNGQHLGSDRAVIAPPPLRLESWISAFYGALQVYLATPWGLVGPYKILHGGVQGDSMGVGSFVILGIGRTKFNGAVFESGRHPEDLRQGADSPTDTFFSHPAHPSVLLPELVFSDDRKGLCRASVGVARFFLVNLQSCSATGGSANLDKAKTYHLRLKDRRLEYVKGTTVTTLGDIKNSTDSLCMIGIPLVMGDVPSDRIKSAEQKMFKIAAGLRRSHPSYLLVLRVVLAFAVAKVDYVFDATPATQAIKPLQSQIWKVIARALQVPATFPRAILQLHVDDGGFGAPLLEARFAARFLACFLRALNCRNACTRDNLRVMWSSNVSTPLSHHDRASLLTLLRDNKVELLPQPSPRVSLARPIISVKRPYTSGSVSLYSDGSCSGSAIGWGALVADRHGTLATTYAGYLSDATSPWIAEWSGKWSALRLADHLGVPHKAVSFAGADSVTASLGVDGGKPSRHPWVDKLRLRYAEHILEHGTTEMYIPAQHRTRGKTPFDLHQKEAHDLSRLGASSARPWSVPFNEFLPSGTVNVFHSGLFVDDVTALADGIYRRKTLTAKPIHDLLACKAWGLVIAQDLVEPDGLRIAAYLRSASFTHQHADDVLTCPFCKCSCSSWGLHMSLACPPIRAASLSGFHAVATSLVETEWAVAWTTLTSFTATKVPFTQMVWSLATEESTWALKPSSSTTTSSSAVKVSPSGLIASSNPDSLACPRRSTLMASFLKASALWMSRSGHDRWRGAYLNGRPGIGAPAGDEVTLVLAEVIRHSLQHLNPVVWGPGCQYIQPSGGKSFLYISLTNLHLQGPPPDPCAYILPARTPHPPGTIAVQLSASHNLLARASVVQELFLHILDAFRPEHIEEEERQPIDLPEPDSDSGSDRDPDEDSDSDQ